MGKMQNAKKQTAQCGNADDQIQGQDGHNEDIQLARFSEPEEPHNSRHSKQ